MAFEDRREEMTESRLALGSTREEVFLNPTPMGDFAVVYIEGEDPVRANKEFAASDRPLDRWFKESLKDIFPPFIDWDQPVTPPEQGHGGQPGRPGPGLERHHVHPVAGGVERRPAH